MPGPRPYVGGCPRGKPVGEGFIPPGLFAAAQAPRVVEDADPYAVGADSISARARRGSRKSLGRDKSLPYKYYESAAAPLYNARQFAYNGTM